MHCNNLIVLKSKDYVETGVYKITVLCVSLVRDLCSEVRRDLNPLPTAYSTIQ